MRRIQLKKFWFDPVFFKGIRILLITACMIMNSGQAHAQVKKYTRVKKNKKHTYNLAGTERFKRQQKKDKRHSVVYSDRTRNNVYLDAYAQKRGVKQGFLTPFFVLDEENDFVEVVAFNKALLGKPRGFLKIFFNGKYTFSDASQAQYIGWIHKNNLLHFSDSRVSPENYRPIRYLLGVNNVETLFKLTRFVRKDTVCLYHDPAFKVAADKKLLLSQIVYLYKFDKTKTAALVSNQSQIRDIDSAERIMGWVPAQLITPIGQQQVFQIAQSDSIVLFNPKKDYDTNLPLKRSEIGMQLLFNNELHKVDDVKKNDTVSVTVPLSVWDHTENKLVNVDGEELLIKQIEQIREEQNNINFHLVFDCDKELKPDLIRLLASMQRLWISYAENEAYGGYEFSFSASSYGCKEFYHFSKNESFPMWIDYLSRVLAEDSSLVAKEQNDHGIEKCFEYTLDFSDSIDFSNNIYLVVGKQKLPRILSSDKNELTKRLALTSSRLIFYQLESKSHENYQEYVLQSKELLKKTADYYSGFLKKYTVDNRLVMNQNSFVKIGMQDNIYIYDSPANSNYQGGIVFPAVNEKLLRTSFDIALDSVLQRVLMGNESFLNSLDFYNNKLGFLRSKPTEYVKEMIENNDDYRNSIAQIPQNNLDEKYLEKQNLRLADNEKVSSGYLLSESELEIVIDNYRSLVPLFSGTVKRKERKRIFKIYMKNAKNLNELFYNRLLNRRKHISDLIYIKTGMPVETHIFHNLKIKQIKQKRKIENDTFTSLLKELRAKIQVLESILANDIGVTRKFDPDVKYYFIPAKHIL